MTNVNLCIRWMMLLLMLLFVGETLGQNKPDVTANGVFVVGTERNILCYTTTAETNINGLFPLTWTRESAPNTQIGAYSETTSVVTGNYRSYSSTIKIIVTKEMNKEQFICTARLGSSVESSTWRVYVQKPPNVPAITGPTQIVSGQNSTWNCNVSGASSAPNVYWQFGNGTRIMSGVTDLGTSISLDPDSSGYISSDAVLQIHDVRKRLILNVRPGTPSFILSCVAVHYDTSTQKSSDITVTVYYPPVVTGHKNYTVTVGEQAVLSCTVTAEPAITSVTWYKDNNVIGTSSRYRGSTPATPSLTIVDVVKEDAGQYVCTASNNIGSGSSGISYVWVRYLPRITYNTTTFGGNLGEDVVLPCNIDAYPEFSTVLWYTITLAGAKVPINVGGTKYTGGTQATPALTIHSLTSADAGTYRCAADNAVGRGEGPDVTLQVFFKPEITVPTSVQGNQSQTLVLPCSVNALPTITSLTWYKNGQIMDTSNEGRYSGGNATTPSLTILSLAPSDAGQHYCVASNSRGTTFSTTTTLTVYYKPIITSPGEVGGKILDTVTLTMTVTANPAVTSIRWRKRASAPNTYINIDLTDSKYGGGTLDSPSLQIRNLAASDVGVYVIEATNSMGTTVVDVAVAVSYAPNTPTISGVESAYKENETIRLNCSSTGFPTPQYRWYRNNVLYTPLGQTQGAVFTDVATPANYASFKCEAYNTEGSSSSTVAITVRYKPRAPNTLSNVTASIGETVTLNCATNSNPPPTLYTWSHDGKLLYTGNRSTLVVNVLNSTDLGSYSCDATNTEGTSSPSIVVYISEPPTVLTTTPRVGQSTNDTGLSTATLVLIIIIVIIIVVVIILIIIYCCTNRKCMRKDNNTVQPSRPPAEVKRHYAEKTGPHINGFYTTMPPIQNGRIDVTNDGDKAIPTTAKGSVPPAVTSLGNSLIISLPGGGTSRPHHLPPLGQDGVAQEQETAQEEKKKKKKRRKRQDEHTSPQRNGKGASENIYEDV